MIHSCFTEALCLDHLACLHISSSHIHLTKICPHSHSLHSCSPWLPSLKAVTIHEAVSRLVDTSFRLPDRSLRLLFGWKKEWQEYSSWMEEEAFRSCHCDVWLVAFLLSASAFDRCASSLRWRYANIARSQGRQLMVNPTGAARTTLLCCRVQGRSLIIEIKAPCKQRLGSDAFIHMEVCSDSVCPVPILRLGICT